MASLEINMADSNISTSSSDLIAHIRHLYHTYRHTAKVDDKGLFISPTCLQICRPKPLFAATTRKEIVQYLKDATKGVIREEGLSSDLSQTQKPAIAEQKGKPVYTIRPLQLSEHEFGTPEITEPVGLTPGELKKKSEQEKWIGMRVDIWNEGGSEGGFNGRLIKVQYWYRQEEVPENERLKGEEGGYGWRQCFHDIISMDQRDGTEGEAGLEVLE